MCQYIKDDGEQCGRTAEPFCHQHEDSGQAHLWGRMDDLAERVDAALSDSSDIEMPTTCEECETALRRTERLAEHENLGSQLLFTALVECDCSEYVLGTQRARKERLPDGWYD